MSNDFMRFDQASQYEVVLTPPPIQWLRGDLTDKNPLLANGCWELPLEHWGDNEALANEPVFDVKHSSETIQSYLMPVLHISYLSYRFRWYRYDGDTRIYLPDYQDGAKGNMQIWAIVRELGNEQGLLTVSGLNSKFLRSSFFSVSKKVLNRAAYFAKRNFPRHCFWVPISAGSKMDVGHSQYITPPLAKVDSLDQESISNLFVGNDVFELAERVKPNAVEWSKESKAKAAEIKAIDVQNTAQTPEPEQTVEEVPF